MTVERAVVPTSVGTQDKKRTKTESSKRELPLHDDAVRIHEAAARCGRIVRTFLNMARQRPVEGIFGDGPPGQQGGIRRNIEPLRLPAPDEDSKP